MSFLRQGSLLQQGPLAALLTLTPAAGVAADAPMPAEIQQVAAPATPLAGQPLDALRASRERPLFSPTRRPPPPPAVVERSPDPPPPPPPPPNVALFGIVMDAGEARAIVRTAPAADVLRVRTGDDIGGWKVAEIEGRRLVLSLDGRLATFTMFAGSGGNGNGGNGGGGNGGGGGRDAPAAGPLPAQEAELTFRYPTSPNQLPRNKFAPPGATTPRPPQKMHR
jgi:general secretion pathway protein N